jgi:AbrB family looped-hinge helix DNA binding protein
MNTIKLQQRGLLTLPKKLRDSLGLEEGQILSVKSESGKIILEPHMSAFDRQLAADIKQGYEDLKNGKSFVFSTIKEFDERMKQYSKWHAD